MEWEQRSAHAYLGDMKFLSFHSSAELVMHPLWKQSAGWVRQNGCCCCYLASLSGASGESWGQKGQTSSKIITWFVRLYSSLSGSKWESNLNSFVPSTLLNLSEVPLVFIPSCLFPSDYFCHTTPASLTQFLPTISGTPDKTSSSVARGQLPLLKMPLQVTRAQDIRKMLSPPLKL